MASRVKKIAGQACSGTTLAETPGPALNFLHRGLSSKHVCVKAGHKASRAAPMKMVVLFASQDAGLDFTGKDTAAQLPGPTLEFDQAPRPPEIILVPPLYKGEVTACPHKSPAPA